jgi:hypothetical protein
VAPPSETGGGGEGRRGRLFRGGGAAACTCVSFHLARGACRTARNTGKIRITVSSFDDGQSIAILAHLGDPGPASGGHGDVYNELGVAGEDGRLTPAAVVLVSSGRAE